MLNDYDNILLLLLAFDVAKYVFKCFEKLVYFMFMFVCLSFNKNKETKKLWVKLLIWTDFPFASFEIATHTHTHAQPARSQMKNEHWTRVTSSLLEERMKENERNGKYWSSKR